MPRSILYFPGSQSIPGYPKLDVSEAEIEVANIPSLRYWPGLNDWDLTGAAILDRMTDAAVATYGPSVPSAQIVTMVNGKKGYKTTALANALTLPVFNTAGSFTVGCVCDVQLGLGSISAAAAETDVPAPWVIYSNFGGSGLIAAAFGDLKISEAISGAWPQKLSAAKLTAFVLIFDRVLGKISIRYNGVEMWSYTNDKVKTISLMPELNLGAVKVAGSATAVTGRAMSSNAFAAFESALSGAELASLEKMLMAAAA